MSSLSILQVSRYVAHTRMLTYPATAQLWTGLVNPTEPDAAVGNNCEHNAYASMPNLPIHQYFNQKDSYSFGDGNTPLDRDINASL